MKILVGRHFETSFVAVITQERVVFVTAGDVFVYQDRKLYKAELKPIEDKGFNPELYIPEPGTVGEIRRVVEDGVLRWETPIGKFAVAKIIELNP
mgnify:CR=1 FL=1